MKTPIEDYQFHLSMLPFFYELDYTKAPIHEKNKKLMELLKSKTDSKIEERNLAIIFFIRRFCSWVEETAEKFTEKKPQLVYSLSPDLSACVMEIRKLILGKGSIDRLKDKDGDFQKTLARMIKISSAKAEEIDLKQCDEHEKEFLQFCRELETRAIFLENLIAARDLTVDFGDALLCSLDEKIKNDNEHAFRYWEDKKIAWTAETHELERQYLAAHRSLPLDISGEEEAELKNLIETETSAYYNEGATDESQKMYKAARKKVKAYFGHASSEMLELPIACAEISYTPPNGKGEPLLFQMPVCFNRREPVFIVVDDRGPSAQSEDLHILFNTILCQFMRGTTCGEMELNVIDPVFGGDFLSKFDQILNDPANRGKKAVMIDKTASCDPNQFRNLMREYIRAACDETKEKIGDLYPFVEDYNREHSELPISRKILLINGMDSLISIGSMGSSAEADLKNIEVLIQNAAKCGIFLVMTGSRIFLDALKNVMQFPEKLNSVVLSMKMPGHIETQTDQSIVEFEHPGFKILSEQLALMKTETAEIESLCVYLREKAAAVDDSISFAEIMEEKEFWGYPAHTLHVPFGKSSSGICYWHADEKEAGHTLIVGGTGSGKSVMLHSIITAACYLYRPDQYQVYLVDLKRGIEFKRYADYKLPHARIIAVSGDASTALGVLQNVYKIFEAISSVMTKKNATSLKELWEKGVRAPRITLVIDEFQILFENENSKENAKFWLSKIIGETRAVGVNVILATQNAMSNSIPSIIKQKVTTRIALKNEKDVFIDALGNEAKFAGDFSKVTKPGEFLMKTGPNNVQFGRAAYLADSQQFDYLKSFSDAAAREGIKLPFETLISDGTKFPSGKNQEFSKKLNRALLQPQITIVLGQNDTLNDAVYFSFDKLSAGENMLIAGDHTVSNAGAPSMDISMDFGLFDTSEDDTAFERDTAISCSEAIYWTLAQSLNPLLMSGKVRASIYDQNEYLFPSSLVSSPSLCQCLSPRDLAEKIFETYKTMLDRRNGASCSERLLLIILDAQNLSLLREIEYETSARPAAQPSPPLTQKYTPGNRPPMQGVSSGKSFPIFPVASSSANNTNSVPIQRPQNSSSGGSAGGVRENAASMLQKILEKGSQFNIFVIMGANNLGILAREVMYRPNYKELFHHIACMQMSEDDLNTQLDIRKLRTSDLGPMHAYYFNNTKQLQRFRPYYPDDEGESSVTSDNEPQEKSLS